MLGFYPFSGGAFSGLDNRVFTNSLSDTITLSDLSVQFDAPSDSITFTDSVSVFFAAVQSVSDSLSIAELTQTVLSAVGSTADSFTFSDVGFNGFFDSVLDSLVVNDTVQVIFIARASVFDNILLADQSIAIGGWGNIPSPNQGWSTISTDDSSVWSQITVEPKPWTPV